MKKDNGITLINLVITIVVMAILAAAIMLVGSDSINDIRLQSFYGNLQVIQQRVNVIAAKIDAGDTSYDSIGTSSLTPDQEQLLIELGAIDRGGFKFYNRDDLNKLEINGKNMLINFSTRQIVSVDGITIREETYHTL